MKRYQASKFIWITVLFFLSAITLFMAYVIQLNKLKMASPLPMQDMENVRDGQYVRVTVDDVVLGKNGMIRGESNQNGKTYQVMVIPLKNGLYLDVGFWDPESLRMLRSFREGENDSFTIVAEVQAMNEDWGMEWYERASLDPAQVFRRYQLMEKNEKNFWRLLLGALGCVGLMLLCFFTIGGIKVVYVKPFEDSSVYRECYFGHIYNMEERLAKEEENLKECLERRNEAPKNILFGIVVILLGVVSILIGAFFALGLFQIPGFVAGGCLIALGVKLTWDGFINSGSSLAYMLSDKFMLRTNSIKIDESSKLIAAIKHRMNQNENV